MEIYKDNNGKLVEVEFFNDKVQWGRKGSKLLRLELKSNFLKRNWEKVE